MDLDRLKAVRAGHRRVVTKLTREVDEALNEAEAGDKVSRLNVIYEQLQTKLNVLQKIDNEVLALCNVEAIEREIEDSEDISTRIFDYKRRIEVYLKSQSASGAVLNAETSHPVVTLEMASIASTRLPKLELQKFKGNITSWMPFWNSLSLQSMTTQISLRLTSLIISVLFWKIS